MSLSLTRVLSLYISLFLSIISSFLLSLAVKMKNSFFQLSSSANAYLCHVQCKDALSTRQKLIAQDYKVSYSLAKACKPDLRKYRCNMDTAMPRAREAKLSYLLLCLEAAVHRGK